MSKKSLNKGENKATYLKTWEAKKGGFTKMVGDIKGRGEKIIPLFAGSTKQIHLLLNTWYKSLYKLSILFIFKTNSQKINFNIVSNSWFLIILIN